MNLREALQACRKCCEQAGVSQDDQDRALAEIRAIVAIALNDEAKPAFTFRVLEHRHLSESREVLITLTHPEDHTVPVAGVGRLNGTIAFGAMLEGVEKPALVLSFVGGTLEHLPAAGDEILITVELK